MIWAIDQDDGNGTSINNLGSDLTRSKSEIYQIQANATWDDGWV